MEQKKIITTKTDKRIAQKLKANKLATSPADKKEKMPEADEKTPEKKSDTPTTKTKPEEEDKK